MKTVAKQFARGEPDSRWNAAIGADPLSDDLKKVAEAFVLLQQAHHSADYDVSRSFTRDEALTNVGIAQEAFASFERTRRTGAARVFLTALLLQRSVMS